MAQSIQRKIFGKVGVIRHVILRTFMNVKLSKTDVYSVGPNLHFVGWIVEVCVV